MESVHGTSSYGSINTYSQGKSSLLIFSKTFLGQKFSMAKKFCGQKTLTLRNRNFRMTGNTQKCPKMVKNDLKRPEIDRTFLELNINDFLEGIDEQIMNTIQNISGPIVELEKMSTQGFFSSPENSPSNSHICESR